jgi:hypothetical protein
MELTEEQLEELGMTQAEFNMMDPAEQDTLLEDIGDIEPEPEPEPKEEPKEETKPEEEPKDEPKPGAEDEPKPEEDPDDDPDSESSSKKSIPDQPLYEANLPENYKERLDEISAEREELSNKFEDGEFTHQEYNEKVNALNKEERQIERDIDKAEISSQMAINQQKQEWTNAQRSFLSENPQYDTNPVLYRALDSEVRAIAGDDANDGLTGAEILNKAHEQIKAAFGVKEEPANPDNDKNKNDKDKLKLEERNLPPNMKDIPTSDINDQQISKFDKLDKLMDTDYEAYERELAKLSPADREAYSEGQ